MAQYIHPEFKPQYCKKKLEKKKFFYILPDFSFLMLLIKLRYYTTELHSFLKAIILFRY
jgi:hypothetical protein